MFLHHSSNDITIWISLKIWGEKKAEATTFAVEKHFLTLVHGCPPTYQHLLRTRLSQAQDQSGNGGTEARPTWHYRNWVPHWILIPALDVTFKRLVRNMAKLHSERNQLFTALMEWNVNLSQQLMTALFSSRQEGHYWANAFFPPLRSICYAD